jgi:hypothetical protein
VMDIVVLHEMRGYCAAEIAAMYPGDHNGRHPRRARLLFR